MVVTKKVADAVAALRALKAQIDELTAQSEAHRATILEAVGEGAVEYKGQTIARVSVTERKSIDTNALKSAYPAIAEELTKTSTVTSVRLP
jgi:hypothetical protein